MVPNSKEIADRVFVLYKGKSDRRIAEIVGASRSTVQGWKSGKSSPTIDHLVKIARDTGRDLKWLIAGDDAWQKPEPNDRLRLMASRLVELSLSLEDLQLRTCIPPDRLAALEDGHKPTVAEVEKITEALECTPDRLGLASSMLASMREAEANLVQKPGPEGLRLGALRLEDAIDGVEAYFETHGDSLGAGFELLAKPLLSLKHYLRQVLEERGRDAEVLVSPDTLADRLQAIERKIDQLRPQASGSPSEPHQRHE